MTKYSALFGSLVCIPAIAQVQISQSSSIPQPLGAQHGFSDRPTGGFVAGNFGISTRMSETDGPHAWIMVNPPRLGVWLQHFAEGQLWLKESGSSVQQLKLKTVQVSRLFPEYKATFDAEGKVQAEVTVFAPLGMDSKIGFLPALIIRVALKSDVPWSGEIGYTLKQSEAAPDNPDDDPAHWPTATQPVHGDHLSGVIRGHAFLAVQGASVQNSSISLKSDGNALIACVPVTVEAGTEKITSFLVGSFHSNGIYAAELPTAELLIASLATRIDSLREQLHAFVAALPHTGDGKLDEYLRWYITAAILLTKGDRKGDVLTMGYRELNQRDSFWTSGIHLVFWKDLERKMVLESIHGQAPSGRIPVTLLPTIDRGDEIDSSELFVLRVARYFRWYRDDKVLAEAWPAIKKAINYLVSRDTEHVGVPMQISYWADWKDVKAEQGRKYAPYFALLWLATLRSASELALDLHDPATAAKYDALAERASSFVNRPFDQGGMWNGTNYVDRWQDRRLRNYTLEDQVVGAYFHVIPQDKLQSIYHQLIPNDTAWGIRETYPYNANWTEEEGGAPGHYHNGGIWPYLNFVDAAGRYNNKQAEEAERILHKVGEQDIDVDESPNEYLDGNTGANSGFDVQGWDGDYFMAIYFGAFGVERISRSEIAIHVHIPAGRDFSTHLTLPSCGGILSRAAGRLSWIEDHSGCKAQGIIVVMNDGL